MKPNARSVMREKIVKALRNAPGNTLSLDSVCTRVRLDPKHVREELDAMRNEGLLVRVGTSPGAPYKLISATLLEVPKDDVEAPLTAEGVLELAKQIIELDQFEAARAEELRSEVDQRKGQVAEAMKLLAESKAALDESQKRLDGHAEEVASRRDELMRQLRRVEQ
jgi:hypothetical protein